MRALLFFFVLFFAQPVGIETTIYVYSIHVGRYTTACSQHRQTYAASMYYNIQFYYYYYYVIGS